MLERAVEEGDLASGQPVNALAHILLAAANGGGFCSSRIRPNQLTARDEGVQALERTSRRSASDVGHRADISSS